MSYTYRGQREGRCPGLGKGDGEFVFNGDSVSLGRWKVLEMEGADGAQHWGRLGGQVQGIRSITGRYKIDRGRSKLI